MAKPFILRSEYVKTSPSEFERREAILAELTDEDLDRVAGGTNSHTDYHADFNNRNGGDTHTSKDWDL